MASLFLNFFSSISKTKEIKEKEKPKKKEIKNLVKDVEYTSVDQKGNKFQVKINSGILFIGCVLLIFSVKKMKPL